MTVEHVIIDDMQTFMRRGYSPEDVEATYDEWRQTMTAVTRPSDVPEADFDNFIRTVWLAGWHRRGEVAYGEPDATTSMQDPPMLV